MVQKDTAPMAFCACCDPCGIMTEKLSAISELPPRPREWVNERKIFSCVWFKRLKIKVVVVYYRNSVTQTYPTLWLRTFWTMWPFNCFFFHFFRHNDIPWQLRKYFMNQMENVTLDKNNPEWHTDIPRLRKGKVGAQVSGLSSTRFQVTFPSRVSASFEGNSSRLVL